MSIKKICFIADGYPTEYRVVNAFVETLVNALTDIGIECVVIAPQSVSRYLKKGIRPIPFQRERITSTGKKVRVYSPRYLSLSTTTIAGINTSYITLNNFRRSAYRCFRKIAKIYDFDAVYGHFIFESGITANFIGKEFGIPAFFAYGENSTYSIDYLGEDKTRELLNGIKGVIAVSSENKRVLVTKKIVEQNRIAVFPNAVDSSLFQRKDKDNLRKKYDFPENAFIVAFTGRFLNVKGPDRLSKALDKFNDVYSIFIGEGPLEPTCNNILHKAPVSHDKIGELLSMADVFVLPTLAEGCCNAIVEAIACGLPIISSNLPFNDDILNENNSIRIDPQNIDEIYAAIKKLKDNKELCNEMSQASLIKAEELSIQQRAKGILAFMNKQII